jgi:hypothetical protein
MPHELILIAVVLVIFVGMAMYFMILAGRTR